MSVVPEQINYTKILPLAVESRARRRSFLPTNGQLFNSAQNNIIQIGISANAFLDTKESYLRMRLTNTTGQTLGLDFGGGHGIIQRLTLLQQGRVLSDIHNYNWTHKFFFLTRKKFNLGRYHRAPPFLDV